MSASSSAVSSSSRKQLAWTYLTFGGSLDEFAVRQVEYPTLRSPSDIIVKNIAISLNPVDEKQRLGVKGKDGSPLIGGHDSSGEVVAVGEAAASSGFVVGDSVYFAGDLTRNGTFAQFTAVDHRLVGHKPRSLTYVEAASLPLTSITVWEGVFEQLKPQPGQKILIIAAAGGVGSVAIQLCKVWGLHVTATASRSETISWCREVGADAVLDHSRPLAAQLSQQKDNPHKFDLVLNCYTESLLNEVATVIKPRGHIVMIQPWSKDALASDNFAATLQTFFLNCISLHFEMMFSRSMLGYEQEKQRAILNEVAALVEQKKVDRKSVV